MFGRKKKEIITREANINTDILASALADKEETVSDTNEVPVTEETIGEIPVVEEPVAIEDAPVIEETPLIEETPVIEEISVAEEIPVAEEVTVTEENGVIIEEIAPEEIPAENVSEEETNNLPVASEEAEKPKSKRELRKDKTTAYVREEMSAIDEVSDIDIDELSQTVTAPIKTSKQNREHKFIENPIEPIELSLGKNSNADNDNSAEKKAVSVKNAKRTMVFAIIGVVIVLLVIGALVLDKAGVQDSLRSPLSINGKAVSSSEFSFMYHYILIENGVDVFSSGTKEMLDSPCEDPNYNTNRDMFLALTANELQVSQLLYDDAIANGCNIEEKHYALARAYVDWLNTKAADLGLSLDTYIRGVFGSQVDEQCVLDCLARKYFTDDYASGKKLEQLSASEEQANEAYAANSNIYDLVDYKILRIRYEQRDDAFIQTAVLHANQIVEAMGHDPSMFELVASQYFTGDDQERLLNPDSTLVSDARYTDFEHTEFRDWLYDSTRTSGDTAIFTDDDGFPIILCFVGRDRQMTPLRNVKIIEVSPMIYDDGTEFTVAEAQTLSQEIYDYIETENNASEIENLYTDFVLNGTVSVTSSNDTFPGKFSDVLDGWIFDSARTAGDKVLLENGDSFYIVYFISESNNPEWYDRVNSFIRMNNYQAFLNEMLVEYPYEFDQAGLNQIFDVP